MLWCPDKLIQGPLAKTPGHLDSEKALEGPKWVLSEHLWLFFMRGVCLVQLFSCRSKLHSLYNPEFVHLLGFYVFFNGSRERVPET